MYQQCAQQNAVAHPHVGHRTRHVIGGTEAPPGGETEGENFTDPRTKVAKILQPPLQDLPRYQQKGVRTT